MPVKSLGGSEFTVHGKALRGLKVSQVVLQIMSLILFLICLLMSREE